MTEKTGLDPYLWLTNPDPGCPETNVTCGSRSVILLGQSKTYSAASSSRLRRGKSKRCPLWATRQTGRASRRRKVASASPTPLLEQSGGVWIRIRYDYVRVIFFGRIRFATTALTRGHQNILHSGYNCRSFADPDPGSSALLTPWSGMGKRLGSGIRSRDKQPGSFFRKLRKNLLKFFDTGWKKFGSGINIPDPQHS